MIAMSEESQVQPSEPAAPEAVSEESRVQPSEPAAPEAAGAPRDDEESPITSINVLCVRNLVLFPGVVLPISVGRKPSVEAVQDSVRGQKPLGLLLQKKQEDEHPGPDDLYRVGTLASVLRYITAPDGSHHAICQGQQRFRVLEFTQLDPFIVAKVERYEEKEELTKEIEARFISLKQQATEALQLLPQVPQELEGIFQAVSPRRPWQTWSPPTST